MKLGDCASATERTGTLRWLTQGWLLSAKSSHKTSHGWPTSSCALSDSLHFLFPLSLSLFFLCVSDGLVAQPEETRCVGLWCCAPVETQQLCRKCQRLRNVCCASPTHLDAVSRASLFRPRAAGPSATHVSFSATSVLAASVVVATTSEKWRCWGDLVPLSSRF